ncbi:hypothetical protein HELRODRAFT_83139 [Helobdella robusta]|uniref:DH domain-containing protein n=1 Tax=Helobdella robusta TaxID=6412 RepID=T1G509_HELRO|nr:hypothetical protein HELRODRAFT_83139 [Helobdella robusta]ESO00406.1 hypothetical protein HELRODRAFT_83139 [Helobdella robusta]
MSSVKNTQELEEIITAKAEKRLNVMNELETTELDYVMCLELCYNLFHDKDAYDCPTNLDVDALFGNMLQIINLSKNFHTMLKKCSQVISCFLELENDFKRVYTQYCRNHDNVIALLEKYDVDEECQNFMQRMMQKMKSKMVVFDLGSILIKPVQRILKYPLLLSELDKVF